MTKMPFETFSPKAKLSHINMLVYGVPGCGKTTLAGSGSRDPRMEKVFLYDADGGSLALGSRSDTVVVKPFDRKLGFAADSTQVLNYLEKGDHEFQTVVIDTINSFYGHAMTLALKSHGRTGKSPEGKDWGAAHGFITSFLEQFRDLNMHVIVLAHEDLDKDDGGLRFYGPSLPGKMSRKLPEMFDLVGRYTMQKRSVPKKDPKDPDVYEAHRVLTFKLDPRFIAKARTPEDLEFPDEIVDPTLPEILDILSVPTP